MFSSKKSLTEIFEQNTIERPETPQPPRNLNLLSQENLEKTEGREQEESVSLFPIDRKRASLKDGSILIQSVLIRNLHHPYRSYLSE